jgi:hypothetical protein
MLSDPLDGPESNTQSFDEDDMYGSDTGVISVSMKPQSTDDVKPSTDSHVSAYAMFIVCTLCTHGAGHQSQRTIPENGC